MRNRIKFIIYSKNIMMFFKLKTLNLILKNCLSIILKRILDLNFQLNKEKESSKKLTGILSLLSYNLIEYHLKVPIII